MPYLITDLDADFLDHMDALRDTAAAAAGATCMSEQRLWYTPFLNAWSGDPTDIQGMNSAYRREGLNNDYVTVADDPEQVGRIGEQMVIKLQLDYIAALERSFRTQCATSIRCKIHAAARKKGHGQTGGLFDISGGPLATWLAEMMQSSHTDPGGPNANNGC